MQSERAEGQFSGYKVCLWRAGLRALSSKSGWGGEAGGYTAVSVSPYLVK